MIKKHIFFLVAFGVLFLSCTVGSPASEDTERMAFSNCYKENTAECFRSFLSTYPESRFSEEAGASLKEIEFRDLDKELRDNYGFDLLLYRLNLRRLKKKLLIAGKDNLCDFDCFASLKTVDGKKYFNTQLVFQNDTLGYEATPEKLREDIFNDLISRQLSYLNVKFKKKQKIDGFSFEIAANAYNLDPRKALLEYYFPLSEVTLFVDGSLNKEGLFRKSTVTSHMKSSSPAQTEVAATKSSEGLAAPTPTNPEPSPLQPLKWNDEEDGMAKKGIFVRTAPPAFSFKYPEDWVTEELGDDLVFSANGGISTFSFIGALPSIDIKITIAEPISGDSGSAMSDMAKKHSEELVADLKKEIELRYREIDILYTRPIDVYQGYPAYEFEIKLRAIPKTYVNYINLNCYVNAIYKEGYLIILTGKTLRGEGHIKIIAGNIDSLKSIYKTIDLDPQTRRYSN
jgi:hypothetical protein